MVFEDFANAKLMFLLSGFIIAFVMGAVINKTNFCTMGAVSDWVNTGDKGRLYSWLFAIAVATLGVSVFEYFGLIELGSTFPPYRGTRLIIVENIIGGILFGIGMTLASGCTSKSLVRIGGGNLKSVVVVVVIGIVAYFMIFPFPGTNQSLYSLFFYGWLRPLSVELSTAQDIGAIVNSQNLTVSRLMCGLTLILALLILVFRAKYFRNNKDHILGGLVVGLAVFLAWWLASSIVVTTDDGNYSLAKYIDEWDMLEDLATNKPFEVRSMMTQSFTFVNPAAYTAGYIASGFNRNYLVFGVLAVFGVILGSLVMAIFNKSFRIEWFVNLKDFLMHFLGAALMAIGAVLALGCTVGQAITGVSTLAVGSILTAVAIVFGSALTMKIQYYQLMYEAEASFVKALVTSLVDLKLLPNSLRSLDKV